jgi:hypothetical protein
LKKFKSDFRIKGIGYFRFYSGVIIGLGYSIILTFFFKLLMKASNIKISLNKGSSDNLLNSELDLYYSFFIGLLSISLAFCFTTYLWTSKPIPAGRKGIRHFRFAQTNSIFLFGVMMLVLMRFFTLYLSFNSLGYNLNMKESFSFMAFLLPLFIFLYCWLLISKIYQSKKAMLISFMIFVILGLVLSEIKT